MRFVQSCAAKINLSLRVTSVRSNGYHNIMSLFLRLPSAEALLISKAEGEDRVYVRGMEIEGENIVARALRHARSAGFDVPFLDVEVLKTLPPGSGLGAGSGDGAAVLRWLAGGESGHVWRDVALKTGADVPFLFSGFPLARVSGIGEELEPLDPLSLHVLVALPEWSVETENAYGRLDLCYGGFYPLNEEAAREEADLLHRRLKSGEDVGFLPNDFVPALMDQFPGYIRLFNLFKSAGSHAWGITGSGGAAFALFRKTPCPLSISWPQWIRQVAAFDAG
ncbi:MAG: 4-diphosphocytidyl-2C-methyl-D-erythritol kinase [Synergistaceae bacterium]|nr:4-diphosphocytidyl-2C-methyl-D-erythritol kinase [Synergistaceae bacterium]